MNRLKITTNGYDNTSVVLNGEEISYKISRLTLQMEGGKIPEAIIEVPLSEVEIDGNFEVLKKIPEENINKISSEIMLGTGEKIERNITIEEITNEVGKRITEKIEKANS